VHVLQACRLCVNVAATLLVRVPVIIGLRLMLWSVAGVVALPWFAYNVTAGVRLQHQTWPFSMNAAHRRLACCDLFWHRWDSVCRRQCTTAINVHICRYSAL